MPEETNEQTRQAVDYILSLIADDSGNRWLIYSKGLESQITLALAGDVTGSIVTDMSHGEGGHSGTNTIQATIADAAVTPSKIATGAVITEKISDGNVTFVKIASSAYDGSIAEGTADKLATKVQVKNYVEGVLKGKGEYLGRQTVATINSWQLANLNNGDHVICDDAGTVVIDSHSLAVRAGEDIILWKYTDGGVEHAYWQSSDGEFKLIQSAIGDPTASGNAIEFIATFSQNENGEVTVTKKIIYTATNTQAGIVTLSDAYDGTETAATGGTAVTPKALSDGLATKAPTSHASTATTYGVGDGTHYGHIKLYDNVDGENTDGAPDQNSVHDALAGKAPTDHASTATTYGVGDGTHYGHIKLYDNVDGENTDGAPDQNSVHDALVGLDNDKADKVDGAVNGHLAGLDANGNLTDSGKAPGDFADVHHSHGNINEQGQILNTGAAPISNGCAIVYTDQTNQIKKSIVLFDGSSDYKALTQKGTFEEIVKDIKVGTTALPKSNGVVTLPNAVATGQSGATAGLMTAEDKAKLDGLETDAITAADVADMWASLTA